MQSVINALTYTVCLKEWQRIFQSFAPPPLIVRDSIKWLPCTGFCPCPCYDCHRRLCIVGMCTPFFVFFLSSYGNTCVLHLTPDWSSGVQAPADWSFLVIVQEGPNLKQKMAAACELLILLNSPVGLWCLCLIVKCNTHPVLFSSLALALSSCQVSHLCVWVARLNVLKVFTWSIKAQAAEATR